MQFELGLRRACSSAAALALGSLRSELAWEREAGELRELEHARACAELRASPLWTQTAAGGLRPADRAALAAAAAPQLRGMMETCGRVCGMCIYQELHRRRRAGVQQRLGEGADFLRQPPTLLGAAFARYFVRAVQHDPPLALEALQAEQRGRLA